MKNLLRNLVIALFVVVLVAAQGWAQTPPGMGIGLYMRRGIDARASGMGGAYVAIAEGSSAAYYNPASLAALTRLNIGGMYSEPYGEEFGITFQYVSALGPLGTQTPSITGLGVGVTWIGLTISDIPIWEEEGPGGTFTAASSLYLASAAIPLPVFSNWAVGASAKYYHARMLEGRAEGLGFDLGVLGAFEIAEVPLKFGLNAMDVGRTNVRWHTMTGETDNYVPWVNKIGFSASLLDGIALLVCDFDWAVGRPLREQKLHLGVELQAIEAIFLRVGWSGELEGDGTFSAGVGIRAFDTLSIDYAYLPARVFGVTHLISAQFSF
ncbi:hypothetical protein KAX17_10355 [Candidatus Bipolaricaulota bacterium]|nr:hypothetical protein [Candidatus Bipolaricaulota bacterium]